MTLLHVLKRNKFCIEKISPTFEILLVSSLKNPTAMKLQIKYLFTQQQQNHKSLCTNSRFQSLVVGQSSFQV